jgi:hypothetical protein
MRLRNLTVLASVAIVAAGCSSVSDTRDAGLQEPDAGFEEQVADYIVKFPYQETYNYLVTLTARDPAMLNTWVTGREPALVKAGEDQIVRTNNDTYYKGAFVELSNGPVVLSSRNPSSERFSSFQLMDDHNVNFRNVIHPDGRYTLYFGQEPDGLAGEAFESPSELAVVLVRVEVRDRNDADDVRQAQAVFNGITIDGVPPAEFPELDLLSEFDDSVAEEAHRRIDDAFASVQIRDLVAGAGQVPSEVSYLRLAAGTKHVWGGPVPTHSSYETILFDGNGDIMVGANGPYTVTTEEPSVDAFWSVTVYDTERGGFLHPNAEDKYHINNTTAIKNADGSVTFTFKQACESDDVNCLEVPPGRFDLVTRYYLPHEEIITGAWTFPAIASVRQGSA